MSDLPGIGQESRLSATWIQRCDYRRGSVPRRVGRVDRWGSVPRCGKVPASGQRAAARQGGLANRQCTAISQIPRTACFTGGRFFPVPQIQIRDRHVGFITLSQATGQRQQRRNEQGKH